MAEKSFLFQWKKETFIKKSLGNATTDTFLKASRLQFLKAVSGVRNVARRFHRGRLMLRRQKFRFMRRYGTTLIQNQRKTMFILMMSMRMMT